MLSIDRPSSSVLEMAGSPKMGLGGVVRQDHWRQGLARGSIRAALKLHHRRADRLSLEMSESGR